MRLKRCATIAFTGPRPSKLSEVTTALLHLKSFKTFMNTELSRKDYRVPGAWASDLKRYMSRLRRISYPSFYHAGSFAYKDSEQLVRLGLLKEDRGWRQFREATQCHSFGAVGPSPVI